jgi:MFS transporter, PPP family, 3-phenylpropionic acid transporter
LAARGLDAVAISWVVAAQQVARPLGNPVITWIADRRRDIAATLLVVCVSVCGLYIVMALTTDFWALLAVAAGAAFVQAPVGALVDALTLSEIRRRAQSQFPPIDYGFVRSWGSFVVLLGMLCGGLISRGLADGHIIWLIIICLMVPVVVVYQIARHVHAPVMAAARSSVFAPVRHKHYVIAIIMSASLIQASHAVLYAFASLQWRAMGFSVGVIGSFWAIGVASEIVFFLYASRRFAGILSSLVFLLLGAVGALVRWYLFTWVDDGFVIALVMILHALTFAATHLGAVKLMAELIEPMRRAQAQGWLQGSIAVTTALATLVAGHYITHMGQAVYWGMAGLAFAGALCASAVLIMTRDMGRA